MLNVSTIASRALSSPHRSSTVRNLLAASPGAKAGKGDALNSRRHLAHNLPGGGVEGLGHQGVDRMM
jgi:hypothetical protein